MPTKSIFTSLTFWGSFTALVSAFAPKVFVVLGMDPQTVASGIVSVIGFVLTVWGRFRAKQPVTLTGSPKA